MIELNEIKKMSEAYSKEKTFTFIEEIINGRKSFYNGYILEVKDDMIIFLDIKLNRKFPVLLDCISIIKPSEKKDDGTTNT